MSGALDNATVAHSRSGAIASLGSAVALIIFLLVAVAGLRTRHQTGAAIVIVALAITATGGVLIAFGLDTARNEPQTFVAMIAIVLLAVALEAVWTLIRQRRAKAEAASAA